MIVISITIIGLILGIILCMIGDYLWKKDWNKYYKIYGKFGMSGTIFLMFGITFFILEILLIGMKPIHYKNFKIEYDVVKETITSSEDMRDTNYTQKLIEINTEIITNKEWKDNIWTGIFYDEKIAELELLEEGDDK